MTLPLNLYHAGKYHTGKYVYLYHAAFTTQVSIFFKEHNYYVIF